MYSSLSTALAARVRVSDFHLALVGSHTPSLYQQVVVEFGRL